MNSACRFLLPASLLILTAVLAGCTDSKAGRTEQAIRAAHKNNEPEKTTTAKVQLLRISKDLKIPSELMPFREVAIYPKVQGFVKVISVDRGSKVRQGQLIVQLQAPEIDAQCGEAQARIEAEQSAVSQAAAKLESSLAQVQEAKSKLQGEQALHRRMIVVSKTPGAIAPYDIEQAEQKVQAAQARLESAEQLVTAAQSELGSEKGKLKASMQSLASVQQMRSYLFIRAPFDGVITERNVHEGSLVNSSLSSSPMLRISQISKLRLMVPVPETAASQIKQGELVTFTVPAHTSKLFHGVIERISHNVDTKTRTMIVEADVNNTSGELEPGMYPEVALHLDSSEPSLIVPSAAIKEEEGKCIVMRITDGVAKPVQVTCRETVGENVEVVGDLQAGDEVATNRL